VRDAVARVALKEQRSILPIPYWSVVRFEAARTGEGPFTYTIAQGVERKAFAYKIGEDMGVAGAAGVLATLADTCLSKASETNDNSDFLILGCGIHLMPTSEPSLCAGLIRETSVELAFSGSDTFRMGTIDMYPGPGGLHGKQPSGIRPGNNLDPSGVVETFLANGWPSAGDFRRFSGFKDPKSGEPYFRWNAAGSGQKDTSLVMTFKPQRPIIVVGNDRAAVPAAGGTTLGQPEFTAATVARVDLRVDLIGVQLGPRSNNT
jgi:hypothetical protein